MRAWALKDTPSEYQIANVVTPEPGPGEVQVRVYAAALNHLDLWVAEGQPKPPSFPHVGGADGAGVVAGLGAGVTEFEIGDEVIINPALFCGKCTNCLRGETVLCDSFGILGEHHWGTFADYVVVPAHSLATKPTHRSWDEAGAFALTYMTAQRMLERAHVGVNDRVLITGIGGGVAAAAMLLAVKRGAEVSISSRSKEKLDRAQPYGASEIIWPSSNLPKKAFDVVIDSVGGAIWPQTIDSLRAGGRFITCGATAGANVILPLPRLYWSQHEIIGSTMGSIGDFEAVLKLFADDIPVIREDAYPFNEFGKGFARLKNGEQFGKLVMTHLGF
jgi:NADPH:quinone reductase-like Zn-dependent oxidoreductase